MKPVILITGSLSDATDPMKSMHRLVSLYAFCVTRSGGIPIHACGGNAADYVQLADAVLFSGGVDVEPSLYGESVLSDTVSCDPARDTEELALFRAFYNAQKPIFGICRGIQMINAALGGTLWQDIPSQLPDACPHANNATHTVDIVNGTILSSCFSANSLTVNSYHHQAIKDLGKGLIVNAVSQDGIVEGVESGNGQILALQWHPERITLPDMVETRTDMAPFFTEMINRTEKWKR